MYKRVTIFIATVLVVFTGPLVSAESGTSSILSDAQITSIRGNCVSVQATLSRIHTNDALSRVHLGQEYETISSKFMAPMNSRVALAKLDGVDMAKTTVDFNTRLDEFRSAYQQYEQTLLKSIQMKCTDKPVAFFDSVVLAQQYRAEVRDKVVVLGDLVVQYRGQASTLRAQVVSGKQTEDDK